MMKINYTLIILAAAALFASCVKEPVLMDGPALSGNENDAAADGDDIVKGWVRIKLADDAQPLQEGEFTRGAASTGNEYLDEVAQQLGATEVRRIFAEGGKFAARRRKFGLHLWYDIKVGENVPVSRAASSISEIPGVAHVQPIYKRKFIETPIIPAQYVYEPATFAARQSLSAAEMPFDDPDLSKQWHYYNDGSIPGSVAGADINLFEGWRVLGTMGSPDVIVAVIDSGVQWNHPDLEANMWVNEAELNGTKGVDDDNNGYYDDARGACFMPYSNPHSKPGGLLSPGVHGTHVAGTIAAVNGNGIGVCGVAGGSGNGDGVKIMTLQIIKDGEPGQDIPLDDVFAYAADNGAVIASCSWTISQTDMGEDTRAGIEYFNACAGFDEHGNQTGPMAGGLCIFGSGNDGTNKVYYPAKDPMVVGVGAITPDGQIAAYMDYGEGVDILAPGGGDNNGPKNLQIYSTYTNDGYAYNAGTSMATPHVSGLAALILSKFKGQGFTAAELRSKLEGSCRPLGIEIDPKYNGGIGKGVIDVALAVTEKTAENPQTPDFKAVAAPASVIISGSVPLDGNGMPVVKYNLEYAEVVNGAAAEMTKTVLSNNAVAGKEFVYKFEGKSEAHYKFRLNAVDRFSNETDYIELESGTLIFDNHAPVLLRPFSDVEIRKSGEEYQRLYTLPNYFEELDEKYGDYITYAISNSDEKIVETNLRAGRSLAIIPLAKGSCVITVFAADTRGAVTEATINVKVLEGPLAYIELIRPLGSLSLPDRGDSFTEQYELSRYFAAPEGSDVAYTADSSDPAVVRASIKDGQTLVVSALKKGTASVTVKADDSHGRPVEDVLSVTVTADPVVSGVGALSLYPNPVGEYMNIRVEGASSANVAVTIYDSAARRVLQSDVQLDAEGAARMEQVAGLAPGVYTVTVRNGSQTVSGTVLKK